MRFGASILLMMTPSLASADSRPCTGVASSRQPPNASEDERIACALHPTTDFCVRISGAGVPSLTEAVSHFERRAAEEPCVALYWNTVAELRRKLGQIDLAYAAYDRLASLPPPGDTDRTQAVDAMIETGKRERAKLEPTLGALTLEGSPSAARDAEELGFAIILQRESEGAAEGTHRVEAAHLTGAELRRSLEARRPLMLVPGLYSLQIDVPRCAARTSSFRLESGHSTRELDFACVDEPSGVALVTRVDVNLIDPAAIVLAGVSFAPIGELIIDAELRVAPDVWGGWFGAAYFPRALHLGAWRVGAELGTDVGHSWPAEPAHLRGVSLGVHAGVRVAWPASWTRSFFALSSYYAASQPRGYERAAGVILGLGSHWGFQ